MLDYIISLIVTIGLDISYIYCRNSMYNYQMTKFRVNKEKDSTLDEAYDNITSRNPIYKLIGYLGLIYVDCMTKKSNKNLIISIESVLLFFLALRSIYYFLSIDLTVSVLVIVIGLVLFNFYFCSHYNIKNHILKFKEDLKNGR